MSRSQHPSTAPTAGEVGSSSSVQYPQIVSFKPANAASHASLTDIVDLNDLFAGELIYLQYSLSNNLTVSSYIDEFYNNDLEYPKLFSFDEFGNATSTGLDVDQFQLTPSYDQISLSSISPNYSFSSSFPSSSMNVHAQDLNSRLNDKMLVRGKNDVIMIPPTMPRMTQPVVPMVKMEGANKSKSKLIDEKSSNLKRSFEAIEVPKSSTKNQGAGTIAASSSAGGEEKESVEMQKVERR